MHDLELGQINNYIEFEPNQDQSYLSSLDGSRIMKKEKERRGKGQNFGIENICFLLPYLKPSVFQAQKLFETFFN